MFLPSRRQDTAVACGYSYCLRLLSAAQQLHYCCGDIRIAGIRAGL